MLGLRRHKRLRLLLLLCLLRPQCQALALHLRRLLLLCLLDLLAKWQPSRWRGFHCLAGCKRLQRLYACHLRQGLHCHLQGRLGLSGW